MQLASSVAKQGLPHDLLCCLFSFKMRMHQFWLMPSEYVPACEALVIAQQALLHHLLCCLWLPMMRMYQIWPLLSKFVLDRNAIVIGFTAGLCSIYDVGLRSESLVDLASYRCRELASDTLPSIRLRLALVCLQTHCLDPTHALATWLSLIVHSSLIDMPRMSCHWECYPHVIPEAFALQTRGSTFSVASVSSKSPTRLILLYCRDLHTFTVQCA